MPPPAVEYLIISLFRPLPIPTYIRVFFVLCSVDCAGVLTERFVHFVQLLHETPPVSTARKKS